MTTATRKLPLKSHQPTLNMPGVKNQMEQKDITGKNTIYKTPPLEVVKAADYFLKKRLDVATAKSNADRAGDELLAYLLKHKMTQIVITDEMQVKRRLIVKAGPEKIKVEKAND